MSILMPLRYLELMVIEDITPDLEKMVCVFGGFRVANEVTALPLITNHSCMLGDQRRVLEPTVRMIPCIDSCSKCRDSSVVDIAAMTCADVLRRSEVVRRLFCD